MARRTGVISMQEIRDGCVERKAQTVDGLFFQDRVVVESGIFPISEDYVGGLEGVGEEDGPG